MVKLQSSREFEKSQKNDWKIMKENIQKYNFIGNCVQISLHYPCSLESLNLMLQVMYAV